MVCTIKACVWVNEALVCTIKACVWVNEALVCTIKACVWVNEALVCTIKACIGSNLSSEWWISLLKYSFYILNTYIIKLSESRTYSS